MKSLLLNPAGNAYLLPKVCPPIPVRFSDGLWEYSPHRQSP